MSSIRKWIVRLLAIANIVVILFMLLVGYSGLSDPLSHPMWSNVGLFFPVFLIANLCFLVVWCFFRWKMMWLPLLGFIVCYGPVRQYTPFNFPSTPPEGALKVLSYNVMGFDLGSMSDGEINQIAAYIAESKADIACLQESGLWGKHGNRIDSLLSAIYPYQDVTSNKKGPDFLTLYSKYPIVSKEEIPIPADYNLSAAYVLDVRGERVLVVNNHLESTRISHGEKDVFDQMMHGKLSNEKAKTGWRHIFDKLVEGSKRRAPQVKVVADYVKKRLDKGMSVIVCGDFNDHPLSYCYRKMAEGLTDCYVAAGNGPGFSYHIKRMYVRIDHILCSQDWEPYACKVDTKVAQSDHYPVVCWLKKRSKR